MLQKRNELVKTVLKKDGLPGLLNLGFRFLEEKKQPAKIHYFPTAMQVELTTACNLNCTMCEHSHLKENPVNLSFDDFKKLLDSAPFIELINFTGIGEILLNPDWFKILQYAKSKGLYVWFNDNFTLMNQENARKIIDLGVDAVAVSFDGATKETYEKIRRGAKFEEVLKNISQFIQLRNKAGQKKPEIFMVFVAMKENLHEMESLIELAKLLEIDKVLFVGVITFEGTEDKNLNQLSKQELEKIFEKTKQKAEELGVTLMGLPQLSDSRLAECSYPWASSYVTSAGEILPCCYIKQGQNSEVGLASMGNLKEKTYQEIWQSKKYQLIRKNFKQKNWPVFCQDCFKIKGRA